MSHHAYGRLLVAATLVATLLPATAHAVVDGSDRYTDQYRTGLSTYASLAKPPATAHPDTAPAVPGGIEGSVVPTQPEEADSAVPAPDNSGHGAAHELESALTNDYSTRLLDGKNAAAFSRFTDGDMIVVIDPSSITGHTGLFDRRYYTGLSSFAMWSANVKPINGVQRESCEKYRAYDQAYGLWVPSEANHGVQARDFAAKQVRKPYNVFATKRDWRSFYCSKLAWAAWMSTSGVDLDADGGYWVWPIDLVNSRYTACFGVWN